MLTSECKRRDEMSPNTAEKNGGNIVNAPSEPKKSTKAQVHGGF